MPGSTNSMRYRGNKNTKLQDKNIFKENCKLLV